MLELGETEVVPAAANPVPTPWSIWTLVALVTFQRSVAGCPAVSSVGVAEKATIVGTPVVVVGVQAMRLSARMLIRISSPENSFFISTSKGYL